MSDIKTLISEGGSTEEALAAFDSLEPVDLNFMQGRWRGAGIPTQHPMDGLLEAYGWYGKAFESTESVHPLLFGSQGQHCMEPFPLMASMGLMGERVAHSRIMQVCFKLFAPMLRTKQPRARLRLTEVRGKLTATMIYDGLPINDVFVKVDEDTVMGLMDLLSLIHI